MIGTTAAIIAGSAMAGASLGGAKIASNAAKTASQQQMAAGQQALAYEKEMLGKQEAAAKPYQALGNQSLGMLGNGGKAFAPPNLNPYGPQPGVANQAGGYSSVPIPKTSASTSPGAYTMGQMGTAQAPNVGQGAQDEMVTVQAPNGQTRQMPMSMARQFVAKGAKILSGGGGMSAGMGPQAR